MTSTYNYWKSYKSELESSYAYVSKTSTCKYSSSLGVLNTAGYVGVTKNSPSAHMTAVA